MTNPFSFREWRHNPCLMSPLTLTGFLLLCLLWLLTMALKFPTFLLGWILQPLTNRMGFIVEFLYPLSIGRWVHFYIMRLAMKARRLDKSHGYHSRTMEQRLVVVEQRVFVHALPQFMDNLGYLIVSVPPNASGNILAFVIDCGDAEAVTRQIYLIGERHYRKRRIQVVSILSTHKHHDHTAGNRALQLQFKDTLKYIMGGAVEKVPGCNYTLVNGQIIPLPADDSNDMNVFIEIEAVATPGHTRGSLAYVLRPKVPSSSSMSALLFTGDTVFSGGSGVPFEADTDTNQEIKANKMTADSLLRTSAAGYAMERCFAELLHRCTSHLQMPRETADRVIVLPGHEYTTDLMSRQWSQPNDACRWKLFSPAVFFEVASHFYVGNHRRNLPSSNGNLLIAPSPLSRELLINPGFRSLLRRGMLVLNHLNQWHNQFADRKVSEAVSGAFGVNGSPSQLRRRRSRASNPQSTEKQWNINGDDLSRAVFTTVYAADLEALMHDLEKNRVTGPVAAARLEQMILALQQPNVGRRPIPSSLPSSNAVYKGLLGFALLGSAPNALCMSDSVVMKLPAPVKHSDALLISKSRLIAVLYWLGLLNEENEGQRIIRILEQLWWECSKYESLLKYDSEEAGTQVSDTIQLGTVKWLVYGLPTLRPAGLFCMPCKRQEPMQDFQNHPIVQCGLKREQGELVRHDMYSCPLCIGATGQLVHNFEQINGSMRIDSVSFEVAPLEVTRED
ncbi:hypothetical protein FisN_6Lh445 [Fistulifera solaris]|uniref:Metallo-beta-lactamase domain-containing protein n=1 Tax=Fistulifera solaris TaxID=1519565 RepID=A0A1Z5JSY7_FISSO|nr:hypothetical protein FisN_6Lh445 [Fistulifera solaris]|eukprot:GAX17145.1 hypothetical protein FisN_6Lh445 [Fistulifera solaris]